MIFRADLLDGQRVAVAGGDGTVTVTELRRLGAWAEAMPDAVALAADQARGWVQARAPLAVAAGAALENLARTLSVEWARFSVTAVVICPGQRTTDEQLAQLCGDRAGRAMAGRG